MGLAMLAAGALYGAWRGDAFYAMAALCLAAAVIVPLLRAGAPAAR